jgi:aryl-alcohol dehydrogenase-like predicted oxidoreductase
MSMEYRRLGNTGLVVSRLAFGAMTFTLGNRARAALFKVEAELADRLVGQTLDAGVNFFDTADVYALGESERLLGQVLKPRRKDVVISTKCGGRFGGDVNAAGLSRRHIMASVDASLERLGTDYIDVYIVHRDDPYTPMEETLVALDDIVRAGKVRYLGFSNWSAWRVASAMQFMKANGLVPFTHGQMYYSLLGRDIEHDVVPMMQEFGLGLTVWSPLAGGFLSGKYHRDSVDDSNGRALTFDTVPLDRERAHDILDLMRPMAQAHGASVAQVAIAWLLARPAVTSVLLGATNPDQLAATLGSADVKLSTDEIAQLDGASAPPSQYPGWFLERNGDTKLARLLGYGKVPGQA